MSPAVVALLVAAIAAVGGVAASFVNSRATTRTTVQAAVTKTLEQVWEQRVVFRDEQIAELRSELVEQAEESNQLLAAASARIEQLSAEVARLSALVLELESERHEH